MMVSIYLSGRAIAFAIRRSRASAGNDTIVLLYMIGSY